jgi:hypothetical protein
MLPTVTLGMRKSLLSLSLKKPRYDAEAIYKFPRDLLMTVYITEVLHGVEEERNILHPLSVKF